MVFPRLFCFAALAFSGLPAIGQLADDAPPDTKALDVQIKAFAEARNKKKIEFLERARVELAKPIQAAGSAGNYVIECMRVVQYEGKNGGNAEFAEWKKKNRGMFSDRKFERASDLYLRYLAMTLRRATLKSAEPMQEEVGNYLNLLNESKDLVANVVRQKPRIKMSVYDPRADKVTGEIVGDIQNTGLASADNANTFVQDLLNQSVSAGLVAQAMKLSNHLGQIPNWAMVPGDFSDIIEQNVRTVMREKKDPQLLSTWDSEIAFLAAIVDLKKDEKEQEKFRLEIYPRLMWKKAADAELLGLQNRALNIRLDVARKYPEHPDFETWAKQIETQLAKLKEAKAAPPAKDDGAVTPIQALPDTESPTPAPTP